MKNLVNRVTLLGTVGKDPEMMKFDSGKVKVAFSLVTNEYFKNDSGERVESSEWHRIIAWGSTANYISEYIKKGKRVLLEGKLTSHSFEKEGQTHYITEVNCSNIMNLSSKEGVKAE